MRMRTLPGGCATRSPGSAGTCGWTSAGYSPGDAWEKEVLTRIRRTVRLFVPVISANTERTDEGYVFREWSEAVRAIAVHSGSALHRAGGRRRRLRGRPESLQADPRRIQALDFGRAPAGNPDAELLAMLTDRDPCHAAHRRGMTDATATMQLDSENPWPGLESFEEDARTFFFGRDHEAESLLDHVLDAPVTVLYGRSGLGKTSLLRAGLFPLLRERNFLPIYVRFELEPGAAPLTRQLSNRSATRFEPTCPMRCCPRMRNLFGSTCIAPTLSYGVRGTIRSRR